MTEDGMAGLVAGIILAFPFLWLALTLDTNSRRNALGFPLLCIVALAILLALATQAGVL